ncbi:methionyl-tRNA formyltransferase [Thermosulfurimonas dismutans]|uniref:Methionyl-tRNA formyltransferase n=1 Tax=Thermosulfurimonas dismutans TaxID=999894 RepID=A0A179D5E6_9BACT|nr:methionyl-tRNA formyltransferase [Thermosulfurimonas dismutans]OAQ21266.1 Methionyl-tRNA formyltransferase [Thermosulfurimonas dismutans]
MKSYRVVFMGTPEFAVPALKALLGSEEVVGVVTQPDRPRGRGRKLRPSPVKEVALAADLPVFEPEKIKDPAFLADLAKLDPELIVVAAYGKILPREILDLPRYGCWNIHASLLPKYRGAAPIQWALINGERETGITIMQMDEGLDTGPILLQKSLTIGEDETFGELYQRLAQLGAKALMEALELFKVGQLSPRPQPEDGVSYAPPIEKGMGRLDFSRPASELACLIRAFDPRPGAHIYWKDKILKVFKPLVVHEATTKAPGTVLGVEAGGLAVATGDGVLVIRELQLEGKRRLPAKEFLRGYPLKPGTVLGA